MRCGQTTSGIFVQYDNIIYGTPSHKSPKCLQRPMDTLILSHIRMHTQMFKNVGRKQKWGCPGVLCEEKRQPFNNEKHIASCSECGMTYIAFCCFLFFYPEGRPGMSDVFLLSGISGLSIYSPFLSPLLFFLPSPLALSVLSFFC